MKSEEIKLKADESYINVIRFGNGSKNLIIISGVSLTGLEGQGEAVAEAYSTFCEGYTVYLFERKKVLSEKYKIFDMAEDVRKAMDMLSIDKAFVYGVSQGGMIAQVLAINYPERVEKMALCSTMCRPTETLKGVAGRWMRLAAEHNVTELNKCFFKDVYSASFLESVKEKLPILEKEGTAQDCERFCILVKALYDFDVYDKLSQIKCPVFVIGDEDDCMIGAEGSYEIIKKLNCSRYMYSGYGHAVYDEAPDIKEKIKTFFEM